MSTKYTLARKISNEENEFLKVFRKTNLTFEDLVRWSLFYFQHAEKMEIATAKAIPISYFEFIKKNQADLTLLLNIYKKQKKEE